MGWITRRFQQNAGAKWGRQISEEKRRAPLRDIAFVLRHRNGMFDSDRVVLSCGHEAEAWGAHKARCLECAQTAKTEAGLLGDRR